MKNDGGPAFPLSVPASPQSWGPIIERGMTLRDYFAAAALQGMLAYSHINPMYGNYHENCKPEDCASAAYGYADAMLAERDK